MGYVTLTTLPMDIIYLPLTSTYHDQSAYQIGTDYAHPFQCQEEGPMLTRMNDFRLLI